MHTHTLNVTRRGFTCSRCGEYFSTAEIAAAKPCDERTAAEEDDDTQADAEHDVARTTRQKPTRKPPKRSH